MIEKVKNIIMNADYKKNCEVLCYFFTDCIFGRRSGFSALAENTDRGSYFLSPDI